MSDGKLIDEAGNVSLDRPLIAYAFLAQTSQNPSDLMSGLAPIFKPVSKKLQGQVFNPEEFANLVEQIYGIKIHPWAAEDLASRLEACGILVRINATENGTAFSYVYAEVKDVGEEEVSETHIRQLLHDFTQYAKHLLQEHQIDLDEAELERAFLDHLVLTDFSAIRSKKLFEQKSPQTLSLRKSEEEIARESELTKQARLDVICASYILDVFENNKDAYELIVRVAHGALLAEVVLNVQNPESKINLRSLTIILDAPLAMSVLDLRSEELTQYARAFVEELKSKGAAIKIFNHSIEEIEHNLKSVFESVSKGVGHGSTARRLIKSNFRIYAETVRKDVRSSLERYGIKAIECPTSTQYLQELSTDDEEYFRGMLGTYNNWQALSRDASSIAGTIRLRRKGTAPFKSFQNALYLFVTENNRVADNAAKFVVSKRINRTSEVPPALTDRFVAGMMWIAFGGKTDEITQHRLLANCVAALEPRSDLMIRVQHFLSELDESKADHFRALMTDERAAQHLTQLTLGDPVLIAGADDASELLTELNSRMEEKHIQLFQEKATQIQEEANARVQELQEEMDRQTSAADARVRNLENQSAQHELDLTRLTTTVERAERARSDEVKRAQQRSLHLVENALTAGRGAQQRATRWIYATVVVALAVTAILPLLFDISRYWGLPSGLILVGLLVNVLGFWELPNKLLKPLALKLGTRVFDQKVAEYGVSGDLEHFRINWEQGVVSPLE